jgi:hypothetical protein
VRGKDGKLYFLKLFNVTQAHHSAFEENGNLLEQREKSLSFPNVADKIVDFDDSIINA